MDLSSRIPNISELLRALGGGSYDKLYRQIHGTLGISVARAKAIQIATGGAIQWLEFFPDHSVSHNTRRKSAMKG